MAQSNCYNHWQEKKIRIKKPSTGDKSLGITIAGGIDRPYVHRDFTSIIITHILKNGLAYRDKQLKLFDIILSVNGIKMKDMKQKRAVNELETSGEEVILSIRRLSPPNCVWIELEHKDNPGISLEGGLGSERIPNDHGIFIRNVDREQTKYQLAIGDRLLQIESLHNVYDLRFVTLKIARNYLDSACKESKKIKLYVGRRRHTNLTQQASRMTQTTFDNREDRATGSDMPLYPDDSSV